MRLPAGGSRSESESLYGLSKHTPFRYASILLLRFLYGLVASSAVGVEVGVGVVYEVEEHGQSLFQMRERVGMLCLGHPRFFSPGVRMAPVVPSIHATHI